MRPKCITAGDKKAKGTIPKISFDSLAELV